MSKNLVIVESPAKAKTIEKYLGADFTVKSSFGHIRDLPKKGMSIDIEHDFAPTYEISPDKKKTISELKKVAKDATTVWLASDEDREGEAISWHLSEALKLDPKKTKRIVFHEITKSAILHAIENPRTIDLHLVDAQQARRVLDRVVGYELSPVLWRKVAPKLSAGRVQSVAVRLIVEREKEIMAFDEPNYFKVSAVFTLKDGTELPAELAKKLTEKEARKLLEQLKAAQFAASAITKTPGKKTPSAPFTTSTLQQIASQRLGFSPKSTMMLAQRLYEAGHITYMRTDSLNLSAQSLGQMKEFVAEKYGTQYHHARTFKTKSAGAQEAHEAIRPTDIRKLEAGADEQQRKLYGLIWRRTLASQMAAAEVEKTTITIANDIDKTELTAKGEIVTFDGYLIIEPKRTEDVLLPAMSVGDTLNLKEMLASETRPRGPARYTEASLVKALEEMGIGRPSTYAPTISTIQDRNYVVKGDIEGEEVEQLTLQVTPKTTVTDMREKVTVGADRNKLIPTDIGKVVTDFLVKHFAEVIDYDFTKNVEMEFDKIADGELAWPEMLKKFYQPFHSSVEKSADVSRAEAVQSRPIGTDPKSGKVVSARYGRFGPMVQIGDKDDDEKPQFAGIPAHLKVETITLEQALELFKLPRTLGETTAGEPIAASVGRFGPYVKVGASRFISIRDSDPHTITLDEALEAIAADDKKKAERIITSFPGSDIRVENGRYGPYITNGSKNARIPKGTEPKDLTLEQCQELLQKAPTTRKRTVVKRRK